MNYTRTLPSLLAGAGMGMLVGSMATFYWNSSGNLKEETSSTTPSSTQARQAKIAIMSFGESPIVERMREGFIATLKQSPSINASVRIYSGNGDKNLVRSQIEDIMQDNYDLICTLGSTCTQLAKEITTKKNKLIPIVFGGFTDPVKLGVIESLESSKNHLTGVALDNSYREQQKISLLKELNPSVKTILIPYSAIGGDFDKEIAELTTECQQHNISLIPLPIYSTNEVLEKLAAFISKADIVMTLRDNVVLAALQGINKACSLNKKPLFCSELESVDKGAAFGFGQDEYETGVECAKKSLTVLVDKKAPAQVPIQAFFKPKLKINKKAAAEQGATLNSSFLFMLENSITI
jgi:putative tryptophan/tyrosine transport system substrate-binding protein